MFYDESGPTYDDALTPTEHPHCGPYVLLLLSLDIVTHYAAGIMNAKVLPQCLVDIVIHYVLWE
jgi:hypothetical protein